MVLWQGLTEGGTAVPVQVTEAGKVVAEGQQGQEGPPGPPGEQGPQGPQGEYGPGDDFDLGSGTFSGQIDIGGGRSAADGYGTEIQEGQIVLRNDNFSPTSGFRILKGGTNTATNTTAAILNDGSGTFAGNKCGFTAAGEIYFTSRGTRYKIEVAGGLCNPVEFTREMQLRELAEALKERIDEKRKPRPTDSVPED